MLLISGIATGGSREGAECPPQRKICQKEGENQEKQEKREKTGKIGEKFRKKRKNREGSFTLPLLTDRASYATAVDSVWVDSDGEKKKVLFMGLPCSGCEMFDG